MRVRVVSVSESAGGAAWREPGPRPGRGNPFLVRVPIALVALGVALAACGGEIAGERLPPNILILIADDIGVDFLRSYGDHVGVASTPNLDVLAQSGVLFRNAWATPKCSATRASILTGTLPSTHGVGDAIGLGRKPGREHERERGLEFDRGLVTLPDLLSEQGYASFAAGKWHLGPARPIDPFHPLKAGFDHHAGTYANLGGQQDYRGWNKYTDGQLERRGGYVTSDTVDDALRFVGAAREPWFGWVAFNAIHIPLHDPPPELHSVDLRGEGRSTRRRARAMVEAMDTEIGRLLMSIDPEVLRRTVVIFVSDNGTDDGALQGATRNRTRAAKGTVSEAGLRVPLIVVGPTVAASLRGSESDALVHVIDLYAAAASWGGAALPANSESVSLVPYLTEPETQSIRKVLFSERFVPNNGPPDPKHHLRAARSERFKLVDLSGKRALYDLIADPTEKHDLLAAPLDEVAERARQMLSRALELRGDPAAFGASH